MDPLLSAAIAALLTSFAAWVNSRIEKRKQSLRPPPFRVCSDPRCARAAVWCELHGQHHHHEHPRDPDPDKTPSRGYRQR